MTGDVERVTAERDRVRRLYNRLEAAVAHHKRDKGIFYDHVDEALYAAAKRVLKDYADGAG